MITKWLIDRTIFHSVVRYESEKGIKNKSTYMYCFHLVVRDFYRFLCAKYGSRVFHVGGAKGIQRSWSNDSEKIRRWKLGLTGQPLVDANMRELLLTGDHIVAPLQSGTAIAD